MDDDDRISELPDILKGKILDYLTIKDAIRTSNLSKKWRYSWTFKKRLDFGRDFVNAFANISGEKLSLIINRFLILHRGTIEYVSLYVPFSVREDVIDLSSWILNWSWNGIQELEIKHNSCKSEHRGDSISPWLFQCEKLRTLILSFCALSVPTDFRGFFNLVTLNLYSVTMPSYSLGTLISRCMQLKEVYFTGELSVKSTLDCFLIIDAPNMRTLVFQGRTSATIILKNVPHLSYLSLKSLYNVYTRLRSEAVSIDQFYTLHHIEKLNFDLSLLATSNGDFQAPSLPAPLMNLRTLGLLNARVSDRKDITFIFCLLRSMPGLETLNIDLFQEFGKFPEVIQVLEEEGMKDHVLNQLTTVNIKMRNQLQPQQGYDYEPVLRLIQILLSTCPSLKILNITPYWKLESDAVKLKWVTKLLQFPRLASNAEVVISES